MAKKHPSSEQIQAMLQEGHFGAGRELPAADPVTVTQLVVEIERIQPYDHNPRRERNPQYDEIKESVRAQGGLNNPLTITRRPGDTYYLVESGGNTRLQILKELWQETSDPRFHKIHCLFRPWVSEAHVLAAHLIENDKRGDLIFIDKALAVRELRRIIEAETGESLSLRQLAEQLQARGYGLDLGTLSRMDYAVETLLPLIPEALRAGLGRPQIDRIRRLESACRRCWSEWREDDAAQVDALFSNALSEHDGPGWNLDEVQRRLEAGLAEALDLSVKHLRLEIDARLAGGLGNTQAPLSPATPAEPSEDVETRPTTVAVHHAEPTSVPEEGESASPTVTPSPSVAHSTNTEEETGPATPQPPAEEIDTPPAPPITHDSGDLESLRSRGHALALKIAEHYGLAGCISATPRLGMGYLIDAPETSLIPVAGQADAMEQRYRQWVWWLLLSLSEQVVHPDRLARTPEASRLRHLLLENNEEQVLALVGEPDWKALGYELLGNPGFDDRTAEDLLELARTCRRIRRTANDDGGLVLWPPGSAGEASHAQDDPR